MHVIHDVTIESLWQYNWDLSIVCYVQEMDTNVYLQRVYTVLLM